MKFVTARTFADPDAAARKLVEIANAVEAAQDGRIAIELINAPFLEAGGTPTEYRAGMACAIASAVRSVDNEYQPAARADLFDPRKFFAEKFWHAERIDEITILGHGTSLGSRVTAARECFPTAYFYVIN